jgi:hypothetical protein
MILPFLAQNNHTEHRDRSSDDHKTTFSTTTEKRFDFRDVSPSGRGAWRHSVSVPFSFRSTKPPQLDQPPRRAYAV